MEVAVERISKQNDRIRNNTLGRTNQKIDRASAERLRRYSTADTSQILARIDALDREWDIDRVLMLNFAALTLPQLIAARTNPKWLWGPLIQTPFLLMHALVGWCPPMLWFRPLGFRTRLEIESEKRALVDLIEKNTEAHQ